MWAQDLASSLDLDLLDFATGGATADNSFVAGFTGVSSQIRVPSAHDQLSRFLATSDPEAGDIFVYWIGANDIFFDTSITAGQVTSLIARDINMLYSAGAQTVLLATYPRLNRFPATYNVSAYDIAGMYTTQLGGGMRNLAAAYQAFISVDVVDIGALFENITATPAAYGIDKAYVHPPTACLRGVYSSEGVPRTLCHDPERHLFFDVYHPVKQVHARIANLFRQALR